MSSADVDGLVRKFQAMAVRQAVGEDVLADFLELVTLTEATVKAQAGNNWPHEAKRVRGQLRLILSALESPEPIFSDKLNTPENKAQRLYYAEAIAQLDTLIGKGG